MLGNGASRAREECSFRQITAARYETYVEIPFAQPVAGVASVRSPRRAARALLPMSRQARGLGRIFRPRSRDKRTGEVTELLDLVDRVLRAQRAITVSPRAPRKPGGRATAVEAAPGGTWAAGTFIGPQRDRTTFDDLAQMVIDDYKANGKAVARSYRGRDQPPPGHVRGDEGHRHHRRPGHRLHGRPEGRAGRQLPTVNRRALRSAAACFRLGERAGKVAGRPYVRPPARGQC